MSICELPRRTINLIKSAQVISSIASIVKELIENAIDAGAESVYVKLENYGFNKIEVKDNGCGISEEDIKYVAKAHFTSKIKDFNDLERLQSYGFRGEALSSLCSVSDVAITTKQPGEDVGRMYSMCKEGNPSKYKPIAVNNGTTVTVSNLFRCVPVRRQYYGNKKRQKEELNKVEALVRAFSLAYPKIHVTFAHNKCVTFLKQSCNELKHAVQIVFPEAYSKFHHKQDHSEKARIDLWLPKVHDFTCSSSSAEKIFILVNRRPVFYKAMEKLIKGYFCQGADACHGRYPIGVVIIEVRSDDLDVNLEPNKSRVLFKSEDAIMDVLRSLLEDLYGQATSQKTRDSLNDDDHLPCTLAAATQENLTSSKALIKDKEQDGDTNVKDKIPPSYNKQLSVKSSLSKPNHPVRSKHNDSMDINYCPEEFAKTSLFNRNSTNMETEKFSTQKSYTSDKVTVPSTYIHDISPTSRNLSEKLNKDKLSEESSCKLSSISKSTSDSPFGNDFNSKPIGFGLRYEDSPKNSTICKGNIFDKENFNARKISDANSPLSSNNNNLSKSLSNDVFSSSVKSSDFSHFPSPTMPSIVQRDNLNNLEPKLVEKSDSFSSEIISSGNLMSSWSTGRIFENGRNIQSVSVFCPPNRSSTPQPEKRAVSSPSDQRIIKRRKSETPLKTLARNYVTNGFSPKRHMTAFSAFAQTARKQILEEDPQADFITVARELAKRWKKVDDQTRKIYEIRAIQTRCGENTSPRISCDSSDLEFKSIEFDIESLKTNQDKVPTHRCAIFRVVGPLRSANGWIVRFGSKLVAVNSRRLNELVLMRDICSSFAAPLAPTHPRIPIDSGILGLERWATLCSLELGRGDARSEFVVADRRISSNGFAVSLLASPDLHASPQQADDFFRGYITSISEVLRDCSVPALMRILDTLADWPDTSLFESRPPELRQWFRTQAIRMASSSPYITDRKVVCQKLRVLWRDFGDSDNTEAFLSNKCLHSLDVFRVITDIYPVS